MDQNRITPYVDQLPKDDLMKIFEEIISYRKVGVLPEKSKFRAFASQVAVLENNNSISFLRIVEDEILFYLAFQAYTAYLKE